MSTGASGTDQLLLKFGLDLSPVKNAAAAIKSVLDELNSLSQDVLNKAQGATTVTKTQLDELQNAAKAAVSLAQQGVAAEKLKAAEARTGTEELKKQEQAQRTIASATQAGTAAAQQQRAVIAAQTEDIRQQIVLEQKKLAIRRQELMEQREEERRQKQETREQAEGGLLGGLRKNVVSGIFGGGLVGGVAGGVLLGGGLTVAIEAAGEALEHFIEKLKEGTEAASKLTLIEDVFKRLASGAGVDATEMLGKMQEATEGLVSRMTLMRVASTALRSNLHLSTEQIVSLAGSLVRLGESSGKATPEQAIQKLEMALARGRPEMLAYVAGLTRTDLKLQDLNRSLGESGQAAQRWTHTIEVLAQKSAALGEMPQTIEQMVTRLKVSWNDMLQSFGKGINLSSGMQVFIQMMHDMTGKMESLTGAAESFGNTVGDAFAIAGVAIKGLIPVAKELLGIFSDIVMSVGRVIGDSHKALGGVAPGQQTGGQKTQAQQDAEKAHPILSQVVLTLIEFNRVLTIAIGTLHLMSSWIAKMTGHGELASSLNTPAVYGAFGAGLGGEVGGPVGAGVGLAGGLISGAIAQELFQGPQRSPRLGPTRPNRTQASAAAPTMDDIIAKANASANAQAQSLFSNLNKADELLGKARPGIDKSEAEDEASRQEQLKKLQLEQAYQTSIAAAKKAGYKVQLDDQQASIQAEKEADQARYTAGLESLATYIANQKRLDVQARDAKAAELKADYNESARVAQAHIEEIRAQGRVSQTPQADIDKQVATARNNQLAALQAYLGQVATLYKGEKSQEAALDKQDAADKKAAALKNIEDEIAARREATAAAQKELERQFSTGAVNPVAYTAQKIALINQEADEEINAAKRVLAEKKDNIDSLAAYNASVRKAEQSRDEQIQAARQAAPGLRFQGISKSYSGQSDILQSAAALAEGNASLQNAILDQQRSLATDTIYNLLKLLPLLGDQKDKLEETLKLIQKLRQELASTYAESQESVGLQVATSIGKSVGTGLGVFGGKSMRSITQELLSGVQAVAGSTKVGTTLADPSKDFATKLSVAVEALTGFIQALQNAKNGIAGVIGGGTQGLGLGQSIGTAMGGTAAQIAGPIGAILGSMAGLVTGIKNKDLQDEINQMNASFRDLMNTFANNTNNLQQTIAEAQFLLANAQQLQAASKKPSQFSSAIQAYQQQITTLGLQQEQLIIQMQEQVSVLSNPIGMQSFLTSLQQILAQYNQFQGAARNATDLAQANQFLVLSLQSYEQNLTTQLNQNNQQAIQDALQLNDLLYQRTQLLNQINTQIEGVLSQGVLTRQQTRAQTAGQSIEQIQVNAQMQLDTMNEQISADQFSVAAQQQIFNLATTRIGLEMQLLALQNAQTGIQSANYAALQSLLSQLQSSPLGPAVLGLINTLPSVNNFAGGVNPASALALLTALVAGASQSYASSGYGNYQGTAQA